MQKRFTLLSFTLMTLLTAGTAGAVDVNASVQRDIASAEPYPGVTGAHYHHDLGQAFEVGAFGTTEDVRGMAEFDLTGQTTSLLATLKFNVAQIGSDYGGNRTGPGNYDIQVVAYVGDHSITLSDYNAASTHILGSFNTASLNVGDLLSFTVTDAFNDALVGSGYLGIRLQSITNPGDSVANRFSSFTITTQAVPEPSTWILATVGGLGLAFRAFVIKRRKARG